MANAHNSVTELVSFMQSMHVKQLLVYVIPHIHADLFHHLWPLTQEQNLSCIMTGDFVYMLI